MVFLFKDKSFIGVFFLILLCFAVHSHLFIGVPIVPNTEASGVISFVLSKYIALLQPTIIGLLYIAIVLLQAIRLNILLNEYRMFTQSGFTTAMAYILLTGVFADWSFITPALIGNTFVIWLFIQVSKLYNNPSPKSLLFNTGLIVGAAILCYQPTALLIVIVLFALAIVRPFIISEWFVLLLGAIMPFYIIGSILFLNNNFHLFTSFLPHITLGLPIIKIDVWFWVNMGIITILLLSGFIILNKNTNRMVIQTRKNWGVIIVMAIIMIPVPFLFLKADIAGAALSIVPFAAIISNIFVYPKKMWLPNILFWLTSIAIIHNNWLLIKN